MKKLEKRIETRTEFVSSKVSKNSRVDFETIVLPTIEELMNKINELIDKVEVLESVIKLKSDF